MWTKLKLFVSSVYSFLSPVIDIFMSNIGPILAKLAMEAVKAAASTDLSNKDKREMAFNNIKDWLIKDGIEIGSSMIYLAIEIAVQKLKEIQGK